MNWSIFRHEAVLSLAPNSLQITPNWRYRCSDSPRLSFFADLCRVTGAHVSTILKGFLRKSSVNVRDPVDFSWSRNYPASLRISRSETPSTESFRFPIWAFFSFFSRFTRHDALVIKKCPILWFLTVKLLTF